jgi:hypothetical protein
MNLEYRLLLPIDFASSSRVWVYQNNRAFSPGEALQVEDWLYKFTSKWQSHGVPVKGYGILLFKQFIVLMADESATGVSGCSTDGSVRLIKEIEQNLDVQLFDRQLLAFVINDTISVIRMSQLNDELACGRLSAESLYFNNTVQTKEELESHWIVQLGESWLSKHLNLSKLSAEAEVAHLVERQLPKL